MKIGIISWDDFKARNLAIARGEIKPKARDPKVWMPSIETAAKILSAENIALLAAIDELKPQSVSELALLTKRKQGNVSRTLKTMSKYGIAALSEGTGTKKKPIALATKFQVEVQASRPSAAQQ